MKPITIRLAALGQLPADFDLPRLLRWSSAVLKLSPNVESFQLNEDAQGDDWEYTDKQLAKYLGRPFDEDFVVILVNVKLEGARGSGLVFCVGNDPRLRKTQKRGWRYLTIGSGGP